MERLGVCVFCGEKETCGVSTSMGLAAASAVATVSYEGGGATADVVETGAACSAICTESRNAAASSGSMASST